MQRAVFCVVVVPDLDSLARRKKGGEIPAAAVDLAAQYCMRYIRSRCHEDLDKVRALRDRNHSSMQTCASVMFETSRLSAAHSLVNMLQGESKKRHQTLVYLHQL